MIFSEENKLRILMNKNRDLRVVPFVGDEVSNPDWTYSTASFDSCRVDEIASDPYDDEHILFKSKCYEEFADDYYGYDEEQREEIPDKETKEAYDNLDWERVILVFIETP
jgi:hypothetical protein